MLSYSVGFGYCFFEVDVDGFYVCVGIFDGMDLLGFDLVENFCCLVFVFLFYEFGCVWGYLLVIDVFGVLVEWVDGWLLVEVLW